ncbi:Wadjet anti-phage system protein JetD domain-containing protein [Olsenella sp. An290]|uniref:Wadjet anti-phage system protein JetD domain-containing protein n=1 Tax=Olsenella sp. An290 TaxID=1965625 RepID=UPI000B39DB4B|nr:Wadjet anti-phage system protein JetD domain-containing protein [Olsenella sp. An290]
MAQKLTEQEHAAVLSLAKVLGRRLPAAQRSVSGGIASRLVRLRKSPLSEKDVDAVLRKYDAGDETRRALVDLGVLTPVPDGGYALSVNPTVPEGPEEETPAASARPLARRDARTLASLDTVRKQTPELNDVRRRIIDLDPRLWINGWLLSTPDAFLRYERELTALDGALAGGSAVGDGTLSLRELSYQLFGDEKFLSPDSDGRKLLHLMGLSDALSTRPPVRLELLHHIPRHHRHMRIVVSENLDPWVNMRAALFLEGRKRLFGERVHGVVFGNGYIVDDPHKLPDLIDSLGAEETSVLYWGDLDRAGLAILDRLSVMAEGRFEVTPFVAAYRLMLKRAMRRFPDPLENEMTDQRDVPVRGLELLEPHLKERERDYLRAVLDAARLIPQEILTVHDL